MKSSLSSLLVCMFQVAVSSVSEASISCTLRPSLYPTWDQLPQQLTLPDPFLPLYYTTIDNAAPLNLSVPAFAQKVMTGRGQHRVQTPEEWYHCRRPEILQMLQEYQYGYYPDHTQETVKASRHGNTVDVSVTAGNKTGKFVATLDLPSHASNVSKVPVVINIGGMLNQPYLDAGIAIVEFDYTSVAADSTAETGAFWDIYKGSDIGMLT